MTDDPRAVSLPQPAERMTTYKLADGSPVCDELEWITALDGYFDDGDPVELLEEVWTRTSDRTFWHFPTNVECYGDGEDDIDCTGNEQWGQYGQSGWMYLCAAHREHVASLAEESK